MPQNIICCSEYQRYKLLKAIHNDYVIQNVQYRLFRISKIQTFERNLPQIDYLCEENRKGVKSQRYKLLKAIHNIKKCPTNIHIVVQNIKDTNF